MRALGPGSVSSFLTVILNVVYFALWAFTGALLIAAIATPLTPTKYAFWRELAEPLGARITDPLVILALLAAGLYTGGIIVIVSRLRAIFKALTAGDPFHPDNIRRLRVIGLALAGLEAGRFLVQGVLVELVKGSNAGWMSFNLTAWFSVLVVFVLAEVFREGARLRSEAELTI